MPTAAALTPTAIDLRFAHDVHARLDVLSHPTRLPGGNPAFVIRHGGNGLTGDKRSPWVVGGFANLFASWLQTQTAVPFDVISVGTPQGGATSPTVAAHLTNTWNEPRTRPVLWPENVAYMAAAVQWIKAHAVGGEPVPELGATLGVHPRDLVGVGHSFGALLLFLSQAYPARQPRSSRGNLGPAGRFAPVSADSTLRGLFLVNTPADFRNVGGTDAIYWNAFPGLFGGRLIGEWQRLEANHRASVSPVALAQAGTLVTFPPVYAANELVGVHVRPYGDPATGGGASAADSDQYSALVTALETAGRSVVGETFAAGALEDETLGPAIAARVYAWARATLQR